MNVHYLLDEFKAGKEIYHSDLALDTKAGLQFFILHGHQIAYDDEMYDLFILAFPNFFEYIEHEEAFLETIK